MKSRIFVKKVKRKNVGEIEHADRVCESSFSCLVIFFYLSFFSLGFLFPFLVSTTHDNAANHSHSKNNNNMDTECHVDTE